MNHDKPFVLRGGDDEQTAIHNRIAAIERIKFLTGIDLREKSIYYLAAFDLEMWTRWYKDEPADKRIDEQWCQRAADVVKGMEGKPVNLDENKLQEAISAHNSKLGEIGHVDQQSQSDPKDDGKTDEPEQDRVREDPPRRSDRASGKKSSSSN